ncbi:hypothetical protein BGZ47_002433 [Haplosporangium gracile]|nr:hypothetical protein BGZ47_002433 [Haplosporangium gracile]
METRVGGRRRVRKRDFTKLNKLISAAFYWTRDARASLAIYLCEQGWTVVECRSEADIAIAIDSRPQDIVVSGHSDMLIYATVHTIWRPISRGKYLVYHLPKVLSYLGVSRLGLTVLGIVCKNDYTPNLTRMGLSTNIKILKSLEEGKAAGAEPVAVANVETMVKRYLTHPEVVRRNPVATHLDAAVRVFAGRQFKILVAATPSRPSDHANSTNCSTQKPSDLPALLERLCVLRQRLDENKKSLVADQLKQRMGVYNRYATVDRPPDQRPPIHSSGRRYKRRQRYAIKTRSQVVKHEPPEAMKQYQWKPWKSSAVTSSKPKPPPRLPSAEGMDKKDLVNAMARDHPLRTLDIGTINANATRGLSREFGPEGSSVYLPRIKIALRDIAQQSSQVKRVCQRAIGLYLERLALSINESVVPEVPAVPVVMDVVETVEPVQSLQQQPLPLQEHLSKLDAEDRLILDKLCPKFTVKDIADDSNINDGTTEDLTKLDDCEHNKNESL